MNGSSQMTQIGLSKRSGHWKGAVAAIWKCDEINSIRRGGGINCGFKTSRAQGRRVGESKKIKTARDEMCEETNLAPI